MDELEQITTRYLLGELSESEQAALEEKYFTDPQVFNQVLRIESELVDEYVHGRLSAEARERFEQFYVSRPALNARVKFAGALAARLDQVEGAGTRQSTSTVSNWGRFLTALRGHSPALGFAVALVILLAVLSGVWLFVESRRRQQPELAQTQPAQEAPHASERKETQQNTGGSRPTEPAAKQESPEPAAQKTPRPSPTQPPADVPHAVTLALTIGGVRGGGNDRTPVLVISQGTTQARLQLILKGDDYASYSASLQTIGGAEIFNRTGFKLRATKSGASYVFTVPADKLGGGDYVLTLRGVSPNGEIDDIGKSLFRVKKR
ncbi:MAG: hypothetical protein ACJ741_09860 [Pyrinomonadaceae bacterium]